MVDIKQGQNKKLESSRSLVDFMSGNPDLEGKLYIGYPILYAGGENVIIDAVWISKAKGIVVFDLIEGVAIDDREAVRDQLYNKVDSELRSYSGLTKRRGLLVPLEVVTYAPAVSNFKGLNLTANQEGLKEVIENEIEDWGEFDEDIYRKAISVIQSVIQIKAPTDRGYVSEVNSKGGLVKRLEETIANLDNQQETAIIEYHDGLQRIRGLAGSGKTIVLALKAAYLHALNPNWNIIVTFNTRSLKKQFHELIELFCIQKMGQKPDLNRIRVIHAWGGSRSTGVYYEYCVEYGVEYNDVRDAKGLIGRSNKSAFDAACQKALDDSKSQKGKDLYDAILVDEAQDLSESFLNLCYKMLTPEKRLIYAYDELQKLHEGSSLGNPKDIFKSDKRFSDIILQKCYRNPRPVLVTAHALGFGIYRENGLVQFFDKPQLWKELGYLERTGKALEGGNDIALYRAEEATHKFLEQEIPIDDIISFNVCSHKQEQAERVAEDIKKNLDEDELLHRDIIVINPLAITTKKEVALVRVELDELGIKSHIAGEVDKDEFFRQESIAFTGINRAKGNEVPMVYVINAQDCYSPPFMMTRGLRERRNTLFTALTRSKAWVKVYGVGSDMERLQKEFNRVKETDFELRFTYPFPEQITRMNLISRDISRSEEEEIKEDSQSLFGIAKILEKVKSGSIEIEDYPENVQSIIRTLLENENQ